MTYERINFVDQSVERPRTYEMTHNADGSVTLVDSFGLVDELGTPINADTMNHLEDGIDSKQDKLVAGENIEIVDNVISAKSGSMPIGQIISMNCSSSYVPEGCLPCDGAEYTQAQFSDLWNNYLTSATTYYAFYAGSVYGGGTLTVYATSSTPVLEDTLYLLIDGAMVEMYVVGDIGDNYVQIFDSDGQIYATAVRDETKDLNNALLNTCSYANYEADLATYGQCAKFAVDTDSQTFRVPLIKDGAVIQQALTDEELGKAYNAGLPNITGTFKADRHTAYAPTGAFYLYDDAGATGADDTGTSNSRIHGLDASLSNSVYGNSDTVQPNAVALRYFVVVANGQVNQSMMDWSAWASSLQEKANTDLSNVSQSSGLRRIVEVSDSSLMPSWYKVFEETNPTTGEVRKWCEQGWSNTTGSAISGVQTITFLKEFADISYVIFKNQGTSSSEGTSSRAVSFYDKTTTTATTYGLNTYNSWLAMGYIKE